MVRKALYLAAILAVSVPTLAAQETSQPQPNARAQAEAQEVKMTFTPGTLIRAELEKSVDAKKAQVGDPVFAKTVDDLKSTPPGLATKGCKITGHVVEVAPHQGDTPSKLGIAFDKMVLKNGTEMPLAAQIQAIGVPEDGPVVSNKDDPTLNVMGSNVGTGQQPNAVAAGAGGPTQYPGERMPSTDSGGGSGNAKMPLQAKGTFGMSGVTLGTGAQQESLLTSQKHNVKIDGGMEMILRTQ